MRKLYVSSAILSCLALACVSEKKPEVSDQALSIEDIKPMGSSPSELWTPSRRKINASYYFLIGEYQAMSNNPDQARQFYEQAYNLDPNAYLATKWLSLKSLEDGKQSLTEARKMVLLYPSNPDIQALYGQLLATQGHLDEAEQAFTKVIALDEKHIDGHWGLIGIYRARRQMDEAINTTRKLIQVDPAFADAWTLLASLYLQKKDYKRALDPARRAFNLQSHDAEKMQVYALVLLKNGQEQEAINLMEELFRKYPSNQFLMTRVVDIYKQGGALSEAIEFLEQIDSKYKGGISSIRLQLVFLYWEIGSFDKSIVLIEEMIKTQTDNLAQLYYLLGMAYENNGQEQKALDAYTQVSDESDFFIHASFRRIQLYRQFARLEQALEVSVKIASSSNPAALDFVKLAASLYRETGQHAESIELLEDALKKFPGREDLKYSLAISLEKAGKRSRAIKELKQIIEINPMNASALNYLAYMYAEKGENLDEALELVERALEIKPNDPYYLDSIGWIFYKKNEFRKAIDYLEKAAALDPGEGIIIEHLADCYLALGEKKKAIESFEKALEARLDPQDRKRVQEKYQKLVADEKA